MLLAMKCLHVIIELNVSIRMIYSNFRKGEITNGGYDEGIWPPTHHAMVYVQWSPTYEAILGEYKFWLYKRDGHW